MSDHLLDTLDAIYANADRLVANVADGRWTDPTPCTEWNVHDLVNHMGYTSRVFVASASRSVPDFDAADDHLGSDRAAGFSARAAATVAAWRADGAAEGTVHVPVEIPAEVAISINILDIGIHSWDLATATGQDHGLTEEQIALIDRTDRMVVTDELRAGGGFGEILEPADDRPLTEMLAFMGRRA